MRGYIYNVCVCEGGGLCVTTFNLGKHFSFLTRKYERRFLKYCYGYHCYVNRDNIIRLVVCFLFPFFPSFFLIFLFILYKKKESRRKERVLPLAIYGEHWLMHGS